MIMDDYRVLSRDDIPMVSVTWQNTDTAWQRKAGRRHKMWEDLATTTGRFAYRAVGSVCGPPSPAAGSLMASSSDFHAEGTPEWQALSRLEPHRERSSAQVNEIEAAIEQLLGASTDPRIAGIWIDLHGEREPRWIDCAAARRRAGG